MALVTARKLGSSMSILIPALVCKRGNIKHGDVFKLERDILLLNHYTLTKLDNNDII